MMREFGGPLGESDQQTVKRLSRLETEIERAKIEKGVRQDEYGGEVVVNRKRDTKAEEKRGGKEAGQKSSPSSPLKELNQ
jgi:hypothetical protein